MDGSGQVRTSHWTSLGQHPGWVTHQPEGYGWIELMPVSNIRYRNACGVLDAGIQIEVKKKCYPQELDTWGRRGATIQATIVHCGGWWDWTLYGPAGPEPRVLRPTIYTDMPSESYTFTDILIKGHIEQGWEITFASFVEENIHWLAYCTEHPTINSPKNLVLGKFLFYWMLCWNFCQTTRLLWPLCLYGLTARKLPLNYM